MAVIIASIPETTKLNNARDGQILPGSVLGDGNPFISLICPIHIAATWGLRQPWAALILTFSRKQKTSFLQCTCIRHDGKWKIYVAQEADRNTNPVR